MKSGPGIFIFYCFAIASQAQIITTVAGTGVGGWSGDNGLAINAQLYFPIGLAFDGTGNYYFAEAVNAIIRKVNIHDTITVVAGTGSTTYVYNGDGIPATTANICPVNPAPDNSGNFYISDQCNSRIRMVNAAMVISTVAGTGVPGYSGDGGPAVAAEVKGPGLVMVNRIGEIVFTDFTAHCIRRIDANNIITTLAGTGIAGFSGDNGPATAAQLNGPYAIAQDTTGNYYISDQLNNRVRKIDKNGTITTIAGNGAQGYSGDSGQATAAALNNPAQLVVDDTGNVFFADYYNNRIRKIDLNGIITTIAGTGVQGYSGDGGMATLAQLKYPWGIALNKNGDLYVADEGNNVIRKVTNVGVMAVKKQTNKSISFSVSPNPSAGVFTLNVPVKDSFKVQIHNSLGELIYERACTQPSFLFDLSSHASGVYFASVVSEGAILASQKILIAR